MKNILFALMVALSFGCGGEDDELGTFGGGEAEDLRFHEDTSGIYVPGQEGRIDGSVWQDGMFNSQEAKDEFCSGEHGDAWFCRQDVEKAWRSSEYHGLAQGTNGGTCYGSLSAANGDCRFPAFKQARVKFNAGTAGCGVPVPSANDAILIGTRTGMNLWDGIGGVDIVTDGAPGTSSYMPVDIDCLLSGNNLALGGLSGVVDVRVGNAPVGPHSGKDVDDLAVINHGSMSVNLAKNKSECKLACNSGLSDCTNAQLQAYTKALGAHEMGHILGFNHFDGGGSLASNVMYPFRDSTCSFTPTIPSQLQTAIGLFNSSSGLGSVTDENLELWSPK